MTYMFGGNIKDVEADMRNGIVDAVGPKGKKRYVERRPSALSNIIPRDGYYISPNEPEYDRALLRERILADLVQPVPEAIMAGHAIMLAEDASYDLPEVEHGRIAIIEGTVGVPQENDIMFTFHYSAFRGQHSRYRAQGEQLVSCSGGPGIIGRPASEFVYAGHYVEVEFWRWQTTAQADGGEYYFLNVPLWYWYPLVENNLERAYEKVS